jgi:hypothetical protein
MDQNNQALRAAEIIKRIKYATLATVTTTGKPWNSPVRHEYDNDLNIYWFSDKEGQHSKNVRDNKAVFIVIYDSTVPEGEGKGVFIQASVTELSDPEEIRAVRRIKHEDRDDPREFVGDGIRRVYKATPEKIWVNEKDIRDGVFIRDYRVEIDLEEIKPMIKR